MYTAESTSRLRASQSGYSGVQSADAYALIGPGAPRSLPRNSYRANATEDYSYPYPHLDSSHSKIPYSSSRQFSGEFSPLTPAYQEPHSQFPFDSHINHESENVLAYSTQNYTTEHELAPISSISRRRDSHPLGISVPAITPKPSAYTPSTASPSDSWPPTVKEDNPIDPPKRKTRREKPKIALAPDQPPTTQGKPRARVYVACLQW